MIVFVLSALMMSTFAIGAVALANVLFFLLNEHTITAYSHSKTAFPFKDYLLFIETVEKQRTFQNVYRRRVGAMDLTHINEYALTIHVIMLQEGNYGIGLRGIKLIIEADVEVVVTEAVSNV